MTILASLLQLQPFATLHTPGKHNPMKVLIIVQSVILQELRRLTQGQINLFT